MGRKRSRKRNRKAERRERRGSWDRPRVDTDEPYPFLPSEEAGLLAIMERSAVPKTCDHCFEFVPDSEGGRGKCLHPASGIFSPWSDTAACDYYRVNT